MQAPTITDLLNDANVIQALEDAWTDSLPGKPQQRHEEGGWIYMDTATGAVTSRRAPPGTATAIDLTSPIIIPGAVVVAVFHTHPNPISEGWDPAPSPSDEHAARQLGVPCLIRAENGLHAIGPDS